MTKMIFSSQDLLITYEQLIELRDSGRLQLGIDDSIAIQISESSTLKPKKQAVSAAFHFWNFVGIAILAYSIYLSFTDQWWWFIAGLFCFYIVLKVNKKSNSENILDAAFTDREFYEEIRDLGGWLYQMEDAEAERFQRGPAS